MTTGQTWLRQRGPAHLCVSLILAYLLFVLVACGGSPVTATVDLETARGRYGLIVEPNTVGGPTPVDPQEAVETPADPLFEVTP